jgi:hypothetical protein
LSFNLNRTADTKPEFKKKILSFNGGLQQISRYKVSFICPVGIMNCYPENVALPARSFQTVQYAPWGPDFNIPVKREYGECAMSFIIMQDWAERTYMEMWMDRVVATYGGGRVGGVGDATAVETNAAGEVGADLYTDYTYDISNYIGTIQIQCLKSDNKQPTSNIIMRNAYPLSITPTTLDSNVTGYGTFVTIFTYRDYYFDQVVQDPNSINSTTATQSTLN